ncbi:hypothetical protein Tco_1014009, partial [Tanacetum coccineum]
MLRFLLLLLRITIYGSHLLILSAYAPSMSPLLSLPLSMACDDSDGCVTKHENVFAAMAARSLFYPGSPAELLRLALLPALCDASEIPGSEWLIV